MLTYCWGHCPGYIWGFTQGIFFHDVQVVLRLRGGVAGSNVLFLTCIRAYNAWMQVPWHAMCSPCMHLAEVQPCDMLRQCLLSSEGSAAS